MNRLSWKKLILTAAVGSMVLFSGWNTHAETELKPFVLVSRGQGDMAAKIDEVRSALTAQGFEIAGEFSPYSSAKIIVVTSEALRQHATKSQSGGYGAVQRVAVTQVGDEIQVSYTNPLYMAKAYRMAGDLKDVAAQLEMALGEGTPHGSEEGLSEEDLGEYHYMFGMEYFDEPSELAEYKDFSEAVNAVKEGLAAGRGGVSQVFQVEIPGKDETLFGVALTRECSGDEHIMSRIDFTDIRSTAHLPYEILVSGNKVYALYARFRIAINFPDLSMMGSNSFFSIMCAPDAIEEALKEVALNKSE